jgi:hypothetical protein
MIHPNLKQLSHSSSVLLHGCPRRYELSKLSDRGESVNEQDYHLDFGSVVGTATQDFLVTDSVNHAKLTALRHWKTSIDDDAGLRDKKTFWHSLAAIDKFAGLRKTSLSRYKLAYINEKPAIELGFTIDCGNGFTYRGFLDALLIDTTRNELVVYEGKTTKFRNVHEAVYKHSGQSLGYSLIIDTIATLLDNEVGSSYKVLYSVYKSSAMEWEVFPFIKNHTERALWIKNILIDKKRVVEYAEDDYFPMHGENCYNFFRPCPFFGTCTLSNKFVVGAEEDVAVRVDDASKYTYRFNLSELIETQLAKG